MAETNVEIVRRVYAATDEGGPEAAFDLIDPHFETTTPPSLASEPDTYRGHEGIHRYFESFGDGLEDVRFEALDFTAVGGQVLVDTVMRARGRTTGIDVEQRAFILWTLRDGLVVSALAFPDRELALKAAEASEQSRSPRD